MHSTPCGQAEMAKFVEQLLPWPSPPALSASRSVQRQYERRRQKVEEARKTIAGIFVGGLDNGVSIPPAGETLWGALNAITAFVDHKQKIKGDRYAHVLFGSGAALKLKAYELAAGKVAAAD